MDARLKKASVVVVSVTLATLFSGCSGNVQSCASRATRNDVRDIELRCNIRSWTPRDSVAVNITLVNKRGTPITIQTASRPGWNWNLDTVDRLILTRDGELVDNVEIMHGLSEAPIFETQTIAPGGTVVDSFVIRKLVPGHYDLVGMFTYHVGDESGGEFLATSLSTPHVAFDVPSSLNATVQ